MEKVRAHQKNEMHDLYFKVLKEKLDEIVESINQQKVVDSIGFDEDGD